MLTRYRFRGVELDPDRRLLFVDGTETAAQTRVFNLLLNLCEARGVVITRNDLMDRLWGTDEIPADEALTQLVFKLRSALGPYGDSVTTVRNVGIRLDATVETETSSASSPPLQDDSAKLSDRSSTGAPILNASPPEAVSSTHSAKRGRSVMVAGMTLLTFAVCATVWWRSHPGNPLVDSGFDLHEADIRGGNPQTIALIRRAMSEYAIGHRGPALSLLESASKSDSETAVPAILLSTWVDVVEGEEAAEVWLKEARERLKSDRTAYVQLFAADMFERDNIPEDSIRTATAILDMRPNAWLVRYGRAHAYFRLGREMVPLALADLERIPIGDDLERRQVSALADRASLGDLAGAKARFASLHAAPNAASYQYLKGRLAYSERDFSTALAAFDASATLGNQDAGQDFFSGEAAYLAAVCLRQLGQTTNAAERVSRVVENAHGQHNTGEEFDAALMAAELYDELDDTPRRDAMLDRARQIVALQLASPDGLRLQLQWVRMRGRFPASSDEQTQINSTRETHGVAQLLQARNLIAQGDMQKAESAFSEAKNSGVFDTLYIEEAALLAAQLRQPAIRPSTVDPPYPNLSRFGAIWAMQRLDRH